MTETEKLNSIISVSERKLARGLFEIVDEAEKNCCGDCIKLVQCKRRVRRRKLVYFSLWRYVRMGN